MSSTHFHQLLPQPYRELDQIRELSRLSADIPYSDKELIKLVCPKKGILMQITQVFFHRLCEEMRHQKLTHYTPENERQFITIINDITLNFSGRQPAVEPTSKANARNERGGAKSSHPKPARSVKQQCNTQTADQCEGGKDPKRKRAKSKSSRQAGE